MELTSSETRRRSIDALDEAICRLSARMDAACYEQLVLIRAFDERAGWLESSFENCSDWLAWRCDISVSAAREKVRVAHALLLLPNIAQAFAEGRLSYTKVRALTRVAHLRDEGELLRFACSTRRCRSKTAAGNFAVARLPRPKGSIACMPGATCRCGGIRSAAR